MLGWDAWKSFAIDGLQPPLVMPEPEPADPDDFLASEPEEQPTPPPIPPRSPDDTPRGLRRATLALQLDPRELVPAWAGLQTGDLLERLDGDATWLLCRALVATSGLRCTEHGTVALLMRRAVLSSDPEVAVEAAGAIQALDVREAQADVAERLLSNPTMLGRERVERLLDCLEAIGDGRCGWTGRCAAPATRGDRPVHPQGGAALTGTS
jgi:hypothetical protein